MRETVLGRKNSVLASLCVSVSLWLHLISCTMGSQQGYEPAQPIAYSHALHAGELQINCLYCHSGAEKSRHAGVPSASICMNCHAQVKKDAPEIKKLSAAIESGTPIEWTRVHRLPDFAYFNHSRHVAANVACQTCHGAVETMVRVKQVETMTMGWCLDCHRNTEKETRSAAKRIAPTTDCSACHY